MCFFIEVLSVFGVFKDNDTEFVLGCVMQHLSLPLVQVHQRCHLFFVDQRFALEIQSEDLDFVSEGLKFGVVV